MGALSPIFTAGLVGDPQYKSKAPDGNVEGRVQRYSEVPEKLKKAVADWASHGTPLAAVISVGDNIDGQDTLEGSQEDLEAIARCFDGLGDTPLVCVVGNHDLAAGREAYVGSFRAPASYWVQQLAPEWRLVVLDTTDLCTGSGWPEGSAQLAEARAFKAGHPGPLEDWNGGLGSAQMRWLREQLAAAEAAGDKVIVASHHPIGEGSARATHMAWNAPDIQAVLTSSRSVVLALAGHDHEGGYAVHGGVHFVTLQALLEAPPGGNSYGYLRVFQDHMEIRGVGTLTSRKLLLPSHLVSV